MKPILTDKKMTCDCDEQCAVYETRGVVLDNLLYYAQCQKCRRLYISEDGVHWELLFQGKAGGVWALRSLDQPESNPTPE